MEIIDIFWVLFVSMLPIIELRGAIPIGCGLGLPYHLNYVLAVSGNLLPVPFILLLIPHVLNIMERFKIFRPIVKWVREKAVKYRSRIVTEVPAESNGESSHSEAKMTKGAFLGLLLFVLIPLPGTGAWTGALVASLFNFPKLKSFFAIALGVLGCGIIVSLISYGVLGFLSFLI